MLAKWQKNRGSKSYACVPLHKYLTWLWENKNYFYGSTHVCEGHKIILVFNFCLIIYVTLCLEVVHKNARQFPCLVPKCIYAGTSIDSLRTHIRDFHSRQVNLVSTVPYLRKDLTHHFPASQSVLRIMGTKFFFLSCTERIFGVYCKNFSLGGNEWFIFDRLQCLKINLWW